MELRKCKCCGETKEAVQGTWVLKYGRPEGRVCLACTKAQKTARRATPEGKAAMDAACAKFYAKKSSTAEGRAEYVARTKAYIARKSATEDGLEELRARRRAQQIKNYAKITAYSREYNKARRLSNAGKESTRAATMKYRHKNLGKVATWRLVRRTAEQQRTPAWLSKQDWAVIDAKYAMARWLSEVVGVQYHVDHIIPLNGRLVSGLHVPGNLQVLRGTENLSKSNVWVP